MTSPRFLLYGIGGVYNYGCEAIVRGTEIILREIWPDVMIRYASLRPEDDARRLKDTRVEIIPRKRYSRYSVRNVCRKIVTTAGFSWTPIMENLDFLDDCDVVLSIGGDLYTMRSNGTYPLELLNFGEIVIHKGKKYVIWGASIGPFNENKNVEEKFKKHFNKVHLITSREAASTSYLESSGVQKNVVACADPAYAVYPEIIQDHRPVGQLRIGINLSPLSVRHAFDKDIKIIIVEHAKTIADLVREFDASVILIPHVICDFNKRDDDLRYLQAVMQNLPADIVDKVELQDKDLGFLGAKSEIIKCHLVIAARMHCAINAIAAGVPTILISYSQKASGMADYVYGDRKWVVPVKNFKSVPLIDIVKKMLSEYSFIANYLKNRIPYIYNDVKNGEVALAKLLGC